jgi:hypothetical protein
VGIGDGGDAGEDAGGEDDREDATLQDVSRVGGDVPAFTVTTA